MPLTFYNIVPSKWTEKSYFNFFKDLEKLRDNNYLVFNKKIIDTKYYMIGIRTGDIHLLANLIIKGDYTKFLKMGNDYYYEELLLKGFIIGKLKYEEFIYYLDTLVDKIDNWAICDLWISSYKIISKNREEFFIKIEEYLKSKNPFVIRFSLVTLLTYYIDEKYIDRIFKIILSIKNDNYYVKMAIAWLLSILFIKYRDKTIIFISNNKLDPLVEKMFIGKVKDSRRVSLEDKEKISKIKKE